MSSVLKGASRSQPIERSSRISRARFRGLVTRAAQRGPVVVVDNYDSFTYNLTQYLGDLGCEHIVIKNDEKTVDELRDMNPRGILLSPGPGAPQDSGICLDVCAKLGPRFPIFGVCMGHQCIGQAFGGNIIRAPTGLMHGMSSPVRHTGEGLLQDMPDPFDAARYHSLVIDRETCPDCLEVTAWLEDGTIMAVRHKVHRSVQGVQFHPESIITDNGLTICRNWVNSLPPV
jgi:anthranilate synthase component II